MSCYKIHKETPCSPPQEPPKETNYSNTKEIEYDYPTEDTVPIEKLKLLGKWYHGIFLP